MFICPGSTTIYAEPVADQFISSHMKLCFSYHPVSWRFINLLSNTPHRSRCFQARRVLCEDAQVTVKRPVSASLAKAFFYIVLLSILSTGIALLTLTSSLRDAEASTLLAHCACKATVWVTICKARARSLTPTASFPAGAKRTGITESECVVCATSGKKPLWTSAC